MNQKQFPVDDPLGCFRVASIEDSRRQARLEQFSNARGSGLWSVRAIEELTASDKSQIANSNDHWLLRTVGDLRPRLDGSNDDPVWRTTRSLDGVQIAYDSQFLYFLVSTVLPASTPAIHRARDDELDNVARLVIEIDTDRDMCSAYRLEVDASGRTRDSVDGFLNWNPRWFVAVDSKEATFIEIAIHRDDLSELPPLTGESWRIRVKQIEPRKRLAIGPMIDPSDWRLATFR